ncbi:MAG TPA: helix-turn-helix domain-containing protein [Negativicutes bacterium]
MINKGEIVNEECLYPIKSTLAVISSKWTLLILRDIAISTKRFGQLQKSLKGISPKTLSSRLQELERAGIISRKIYPEVPPRVEYSLTSQGDSLKTIILSLAEWGKEHLTDK